VGVVASYTFDNVTADHTIAASFTGGGGAPGLAGWWPMDEGSGSVILDASGEGNDGALANAPTWGPGVNGLALQLNGSGQYATVAPSATLDMSDAITLAAWVKPGKFGTQNIISKGVVGGTDGYELNLSSTDTGHPFVRLNQLSLTPRLDALASYPTDGNTWMHVAATFDGVYIRIFVNGLQDNLSPVTAGLTVRTNTLPLAIGAQVDGTGAADRYYQGAIDDARVYGRALSAAEIRVLAGLTTYTITASAGTGGSISPSGSVLVIPGAGQSFTITPDPSYTVADVLVDGASVGPATTYTFDNVAANHTIAASFTFSNAPPEQPVLAGPANDATGVTTSPSLDVTVSDPEGSPLTVTYYARAASLMPPAPDFSIVVLPDAQNYTGSAGGGSPAMFTSQIQWIVDGISARHTVYAAQVGDLVNLGDNGGNTVEYDAASAALSLIENPTTTGMTYGLPYGVAVGNHEQVPSGATLLYNQYFGVTRFAGRSYYGGHYGANNNNHFDLFSASGMDFLVIYVEISDSPSAAVLSWADNLLKTYPARRGILVYHYLINPGDPGTWSTQGQAIYNALKGNPSLFLMVCGHVSEEGKRADTYNGNTVYTLLADYQSRTAGGNGWLRLLEFSPANDEIRVKTYSPWLDQWETDASSQFTLAYDMPATMPDPFVAIGTVSGVVSGSTAHLPWPGRAPQTVYEWYVTVSDGALMTTGPTWKFTTGSGGPPPEPVANLHATQARTGNTPGSTTKIDLSWDATPAGTTVEIWRAGFGHYPEYDDAGGAVPSTPGTHEPATPWTRVGAVASPATTLTDLPMARDYYYYVAYVQDASSAWSDASAMTAGTLGYHLGDVAGPPPYSLGDNSVGTADVSALGGQYGNLLPPGNAFHYLDVGPTTNRRVDGRPTTDNRIGFEDLVMFAMNYGAAAAPQVLASDKAAGTDEIVLQAPGQVTTGTVVAQLTLRGSGALKALSTRLTWDPAVVRPTGYTAGEWLTAQDGVAFSPAPGTVDAAVLGAAGMAGEGELASVTFEVLAAGDPQIRIDALDGRDAMNQTVTVTGGITPVGSSLPAVTQLGPARPNPARGAATISFSLAERGAVDLTIYAVDGRMVRALTQGPREPGEYSLVWDGRDDDGNAVPAGVYYTRLVTARGSFARAITYLK
jgi:hypothetical protein